MCMKYFEDSVLMLVGFVQLSSGSKDNIFDVLLSAQVVLNIKLVCFLEKNWSINRESTFVCHELGEQRRRACSSKRSLLCNFASISSMRIVTVGSCWGFQHVLRYFDVDVRSRTSLCVCIYIIYRTLTTKNRILRDYSTPSILNR